MKLRLFFLSVVSLMCATSIMPMAELAMHGEVGRQWPADESYMVIKSHEITARVFGPAIGIHDYRTFFLVLEKNIRVLGCIKVKEQRDVEVNLNAQWHPQNGVASGIWIRNLGHRYKLC